MPLVSSYSHVYEFVLKKHGKLPYTSGNRKKEITLVNTDMILHLDKVYKGALSKKNVTRNQEEQIHNIVSKDLLGTEYVKQSENTATMG